MPTTGGRATGSTDPVVAIGDHTGGAGGTFTGGTDGPGVVGTAGTTGNGGTFTATSGNAVAGTATTGSGVVAAATGTAGVGLTASSSAGYGAVIGGDATSPVYAALRLIPQDTLPTNALVGDLCVISGKLNICTVSHTTTPTFVVVGDQTA